MGWNQASTPLATVAGIDPLTRSKLHDHHITTAEQLVGQIEASPHAVADLLELDESRVHEIAGHARAALPESTLQEFERQRSETYRLGARDPDERPDET